jgi:hypothetical protein
MRTAMQVIIDDVKENNPHDYHNNKQWYDGLLEKEKQQIIDAQEDGHNYYEEGGRSGEQYYNQTYKTN